MLNVLQGKQRLGTQQVLLCPYCPGPACDDPAGSGEGPMGPHLSSQGPICLLLGSPHQRPLLPFIAVCTQGWLTLSPSFLPESA